MLWRYMLLGAGMAFLAWYAMEISSECAAYHGMKLHNAIFKDSCECECSATTKDNKQPLITNAHLIAQKFVNQTEEGVIRLSDNTTIIKDCEIVEAPKFMIFYKQYLTGDDPTIKPTCIKYSIDDNKKRHKCFTGADALILKANCNKMEQKSRLFTLSFAVVVSTNS